MAVVLTPPPPRATPFFQNRPHIQGPQLPGSLQPPPEDGQNAGGGMAAVAPPQVMSQTWSGWFRTVFNVLKPGATKTVVISGTTLTFVNGIFTGSSP